MNGLRDVREALTFAYANDLIDDEEYLLMYDVNLSKDVFPYWKFEGFNFEDWDNTECKTELRFAKADILQLVHHLRLPEKFICSQGTVCSGLEGFCILLKRLAYPCRYTDIVHRFGRSVPELCLIFNQVLDFIYSQHHHLLTSWDQNILRPAKLGEYAAAIHRQGAPLSNCFGFIDGTVRPISRPNKNQRVMYNGHKRVHCIKFQSVVIPNGLIANLQGPFEGKRHDSSMLHESGLMNDLHRVGWLNGQPLCLYGDPAYPLTGHLQAPFKNVPLTQEMRNFNKAMSENRVAVEWLFGNIVNFFKFVDFKKEMKINLSPVGKIYMVCGILENAHACLYGNIVSDFFEVNPPALAEYFL